MEGTTLERNELSDLLTVNPRAIGVEELPKSNGAFFTFTYPNGSGHGEVKVDKGPQPDPNSKKGEVIWSEQDAAKLNEAKAKYEEMKKNGCTFVTFPEGKTKDPVQINKFDPFAGEIEAFLPNVAG